MDGQQIRVRIELLRSLIRKMTLNKLEVCSSSGVSHVTHMLATYPYKFLQISTSIYANVFLLGFGGGSVAGDIQELKVILKEDAILLLRTQGSTKIFKSVDGKYCSQRVSVNLASGSLFAFLPDPTTCFKDSRYCQYQIYYMHEAARCDSSFTFYSSKFPT